MSDATADVDVLPSPDELFVHLPSAVITDDVQR
jgi:hypothetical protein